MCKCYVLKDSRIHQELLDEDETREWKQALGNSG